MSEAFLLHIRRRKAHNPRSLGRQGASSAPQGRGVHSPRSPRASGVPPPEDLAWFHRWRGRMATGAGGFRRPPPWPTTRRRLQRRRSSRDTRHERFGPGWAGSAWTAGARRPVGNRDGSCARGVRALPGRTRRRGGRSDRRQSERQLARGVSVTKPDWLKPVEELTGRNLECFSQAQDREKAGVAPLALDPVDLGRVEVGTVAECFPGRGRPFRVRLVGSCRRPSAGHLRAGRRLVICQGGAESATPGPIREAEETLEDFALVDEDISLLPARPPNRDW